MEKNQELIGVVDGLGSNGEGIIHEDGYTVFVPFSLIGEKIKYKVLKVKKPIAYGKVLEVLTESEYRQRPNCAVFSKCGGCDLQHAKYDEQLRFKAENVKTCFRKIARIDLSVNKIVPSDIEYGYRNKLQLPIRKTEVGNSVGFFAENSHRIIPIDECPLHPKWSKEIIDVVKKFILIDDVTCYDETTGKGLLRQVVVKEISSKLMIIFVITSDKIPHVEKLISLLDDHFIDYSLYYNVNKDNNNVVFGNEFVHIKGDKEISCTEFGITYSVGPEAFIQVNDNVKHKLYQAVKDAVSNMGNNIWVINAYSGGGVLTAMLAENAEHVTGVEIVREAVDSANLLVEKNVLKNKIDNICAPCEDVLPKLIKEIKDSGKRCVLVLDPPRKGIEPNIIDAILCSKPDCIIYVSCSPQSLSRDIGLIVGTLTYDGKQLKNADKINDFYKIYDLQIFDMFPQTRHVETVIGLYLK